MTDQTTADRRPPTADQQSTTRAESSDKLTGISDPSVQPTDAPHASPTPYSLLPSPYSPLLVPTPYFLLLLSGGGIFLEITLTRLFSTLFFPPYVFAVISLAILGIGLGAALATALPGWRDPARLSLYSALAGFAALALLLAAVWTTSQDLPGLLLGLALGPYFFVGLALVTIFSAVPTASPRLYRADLLGAGLGAILAIPFLNLLGGINSIILAAGIFGLAGLATQNPGFFKKPGFSPRGWSLALCALALGGLTGNLIPTTKWLTVDMAGLSPPKPITDSLAAGGQILHTSWDSFARTDLVDPGQDKPYELYIDGAAGSVMPPAGDINLLRTDIGFFPFATEQPERVMVIGPGGGLDVWFALSSQAQAITAVEVNSASVAIVNRFASYHGNLYGQPGVRVMVDEGRSLLRREGQHYDLIYLSQVVTLAAERNGYALTENTIYTVEAFNDYLAHLRPGGQIAMKLYDELTLSRALVTAVTALSQIHNLSEPDAMAHIAAFLDPKTDPPIPLLLVQDQPFSRDEALAYAGVAAQVGFAPLFVPGVVGNQTLEPVLTGQSSLAEVISTSASDISATTDNRPFFYQFERGLPQSLRPLLWGLAGVALVGFVGVVLIQRKVVTPMARYAPVYFAAVGVGFIAIEIALIQQTRLFLGHPTLAVTSVLAVLLIGGGLGSGLAGRWFNPTHRRPLVWPIAGVVLLVGLWLLIWPWLNHTFSPQAALIRVLVVVISLTPLALVMGMPFPLGLRIVGQFESGDRHVALGWAVNGVMTVAGSAGAVAIAIIAGFSTVLWVGAGAYLVAAIFAFIFRRG